MSPSPTPDDPRNAAIPSDNSSLSADDQELLRRAMAAGVVSAPLHARLAAADQSGIPWDQIVTSTPDARNEWRKIRELFAEASPGDASTAAGAEQTVAGPSAHAERLEGLPPRYRLERPLGAGGMGRVFQAFDLELRRSVAIKVLRAGRRGEAWSRIMRREVEMLAALARPGIVAAYDSGRLSDGAPYFVMQYVAGDTLSEYCARTKPNLRRRAELLAQVATAVGWAHLVRIVHRDLKPANIKVGEDGRPVVLDFGLAKQFLAQDGPPDQGEETSAGPASPGESLLGRGAGTPAYMSPEQAAGDESDARSDVYSLGVVLYELLAGRTPALRSDDRLRSAPALLPAVPRDLAAVVRRCLARDPGERYADGRELAADLDRFLTDHAVAAYAPGRPWYRAGRFLSRHRVSATAAFVAVAACLIATVVAVHASFQRLADLHDRQIAGERLQRAEQDRQTQELLARAAQEVAERMTAAEGSARFREARAALDDGRHEEASQSLDQLPLARAGFESDHLRTIAGSRGFPDRTYGFHQYQTFQCVLSPDERTLVTSGMDGRVVAWNVATGEETMLHAGVWNDKFRRWAPALRDLVADPLEAVVVLRWLDAGSRLAGATDQGRLVCWDVGARREHACYQFDAPLVALDVDGAGRALVADVRGRLFACVLPTKNLPLDDFDPSRDGSPLPTPRQVERPASTQIDVEVDALRAFGPDLWCVARADRELMFLDRTTLQARGRLTLDARVWDLATDPAGATMAAACDDGRIVLVETSSAADSPPRIVDQWRLAPKPDGTRGAVHAVAFDSAHRRLLAADDSGGLVAWDLGRREPLFRLLQSGLGFPNLPENLPRYARRACCGLSVSQDGRRLFAAGQDSYVNRWPLPQRFGITEFRVRPDALVRFDPRSERELWIASDRSLARLDPYDAAPPRECWRDDEPILDLSVADSGQCVAIATSRTIRAWRPVDVAGATPGAITSPGASATPDARARDTKLDSVGPVIRTVDTVRHISLAPSGDRVAAYDAEDRVTVYDLRDGTVVGQIKFAKDISDESLGLVSFSPDGTRLAVCGRGNSSVILDSKCQIVDRPSLTASGGTRCIAWSTLHPDVLLAGDRVGSVRSTDRARCVDVASPARYAAVAGITFAPDGARYAIGRETGEILIYDPRLRHLVGSLRSGTQDGSAPLRDLRFAARGDRLLAQYADGNCEILETRVRPGTPAPATEVRERPWTLRRHVLGPHVVLTAAPFALNAQGRLSALYLKTGAADASAPERPALRFTWGRETATNWEETTLREFSHSPSLTAGDLQRHVAIGTLPPTGTPHVLLARPPEPGGGDWTTELIDPASGHSLWPVATGATFDRPHLLGSSAEPVVSHFSFGGYYLKASSLEAGRVVHRDVGRQGDGKEHVATSDANGRLHFAFAEAVAEPAVSRRLIYHSVEDVNVPYRPDTPGPHRREVVADGAHAAPVSLTVDDAGEPELLYVSRPAGNMPDDRVWGEVRLAIRRDGLWTHEAVCEIRLRDNSISPHVRRADGRKQFLVRENRADRVLLWLVSSSPSGWTRRAIHEFSSTAGELAPLGHVTLMLDARDRPTAAAALLTAPHIEFLVLRPDSSAP